MEREKFKKVSFEKIIKELYEKNGTIEASFTSKLLSIIDERYPIWDTYVLKNLHIKVSTNNDKEIRLAKVMEAYSGMNNSMIESVDELYKGALDCKINFNIEN